MGRRITVVLSDDVIKKLRERQAKLIKASSKSVSFSRVVNEALRKSVKQMPTWNCQNCNMPMTLIKSIPSVTCPNCGKKMIKISD